MRGVAFSHIGQYQKAIDDTNKAIDLGQGGFKGFIPLTLVVSYRELGQHQRAIEEFGKLTHDETVDGSAERCYYNFAMNAHPKEAWPYAGRGNASVKMATYFRRQAGLPPEPTSQSQLRLQAKISGFYTAAIEDCSIAIALDPKFAQAYATRGIAYRELKQHQKAVEDFKRAISLDPNLAQQIALH